MFAAPPVENDRTRYFHRRFEEQVNLKANTLEVSFLSRNPTMI